MSDKNEAGSVVVRPIEETPDILRQIAEMEEALQKTYAFSLSPEEIGNFEQWKTEHDPDCPCRVPRDAMRMRFTFHFTPGSIGTAITIQCACGGEKDVTDYASW